jgi:hypothetical protein
MPFPPYQDGEAALLSELQRRGGRARPTDKDEHRRTVYEALADHFNLTQEDRDTTIVENGQHRSKWHNMVRWAVRQLRKQDRLRPSKDEHGIWAVV